MFWNLTRLVIATRSDPEFQVSAFWHLACFTLKSITGYFGWRGSFISFDSTFGQSELKCLFPRTREVAVSCPWFRSFLQRSDTLISMSTISITTSALHRYLNRLYRYLRRPFIDIYIDFYNNYRIYSNKRRPRISAAPPMLSPLIFSLLLSWNSRIFFTAWICLVILDLLSV